MYFDDELSGDEIGFSLKKIAKAIKKIGPGGKKKKSKKPASFEKVSEGIQRVPLGLPVLTFSSGGATSQTATVNPQKKFLPRRLIVQVERSSGASAVQVLVSSIRIGTQEVLAGSGPIPAETFANNVMDSLIQTVPAYPGLEISVRYEIVGTIGSGESVTVATAFLGDAAN